jgi:hypothetical protein
MTDQSTELTTSAESTAVAPITSDNLLALIVQAARDPSIDADKMKTLADLATGMQDREAARRFHMAKHAAVQEMPSITKRGAITNKAGQVQSRYSRYEDIMRVVKPILDRHHLIVTFNVGHNGGQTTVQPVVSYSDGELAYQERGEFMSLAIDTTGSKNATQGAGSASSYGKRHALKATFNIVEEGEDDDGGGAREELSPTTLALIEAAREAARNGTAAYKAYFEGISASERKFLGEATEPSGKTYHDTNKESAKVFD